MKKILGLAGAIALSIIPTPSFSGEVEQKEMMSVTEQLLPQIGEKYYYLNKKEKKAYKKNLLKYLKKVEKLEPTGVGEALRSGSYVEDLDNLTVRDNKVPDRDFTFEFKDLFVED